MIDYDGNKKMFVNDQAVVDYDNFMKEQLYITEDEEIEEKEDRSPYQQARIQRSSQRLNNDDAKIDLLV